MAIVIRDRERDRAMNGTVNFFAYNTTFEPEQVECLLDVSQSCGATKVENFANHTFVASFGSLSNADLCRDEFTKLVEEWGMHARVTTVDSIDYPCE